MRCPTLNELSPPPPGKTGWPWTAESIQLPDLGAGGFPYPRISIVTPSYNQGAFLEATIRSVLLQGYPSLEYIVIDGGSEDESVQIIRKYERWLSYWVSEPDGGQYDAINKGFAVTTGEVMTWLNSDDMYVPGSFRIAGTIFAIFAGEVEWITGIPAHWDSDGNPCTVYGLKRYDSFLMRLGLYEGCALGWVQSEGTFWSRSLWTRAGGALDDKLQDAADFDLWRRLAHYADLYSVSMILGRFRVHSRQKTALQLDLYFREVDQILSKSKCARWLRRLATTRIGRIGARCYLKARRQRRVISYNARMDQWMMRR